MLFVFFGIYKGSSKKTRQSFYLPPHLGLVALRLHKGGRCNVLVIGVGARSNAFHSRRLKRANAIVNSSVHVGQGDVWNDAPLDCGLGRSVLTLRRC